MNPGDAVERAIAGRGYRKTTEVTPRTIRELERHHGSKRAAAAAAGVSPETWRRWGLGTQKPKGSSVTRMADALRRVRLSAGRRRRLTSGRPLIQLAATTQVSADKRERDLGTSSLAPSHDQMLTLIDAYERGDHHGMETALGSIVANYVPEMEVLDVHSLWLGSGDYGDDGDE